MGLWEAMFEGGVKLASAVEASTSAAAQREANAVNLRLGRETNQTNIDIAKANNALQVEQNALSRQYATESQQREFDQQMKMWELQTLYNNPVEQVARYKAAGLNPAVMMSQGGASVVQSMPNVPGGISPGGSGIIPSSPVLQQPRVEPVPGIFGKFATTLSDLANSYKAFHSAGLDKAQTKETLETLQGKIRNLFASAENEEALAAGQKLSNFFEQTYGAAMRESRIDSIVMEGYSHYASAYLALCQGDTEKFKRYQLLAEAAMNRSVANLNGEKAKEQANRNEVWREMWDLEVKETRSRIGLNNASAAESSENAKRIRELLPGEKQIQAAQKALMDKDVEYKTEEIKQSQALRSKIAKECVLLTKAAAHADWSTETEMRMQIYIEQQIEKEIRQQGADYWNPFRYVGTVFGGTAAASVTAASKAPAARAVVRGFVP